MENTNKDSHENVLKHIEFVQDIITRQAQNSFVVKGWSITIVSIIFVIIGTSGLNPSLVLFCLIPAIGFWFLDALYLHQEREYRALYNAIAEDLRMGTRKVELFDLNAAKYAHNLPSILSAMFTPTVIVVPIIIVTLSFIVRFIITP